ncbi:uncharacterized protein LOC144658964 isoform X2 [Oculina patagonica]
MIIHSHHQLHSFRNLEIVADSRRAFVSIRTVPRLKRSSSGLVKLSEPSQVSICVISCDRNYHKTKSALKRYTRVRQNTTKQILRALWSKRKVKLSQLPVSYRLFLCRSGDEDSLKERTPKIVSHSQQRTNY